MKYKRDRPETAEVIRKAEELIGYWDQRGGLTYRELAARLFAIFDNAESITKEEPVQINH